MQYPDDPKKAAEVQEALRHMREEAMPKGPRGEKRPKDVVSAAVKVARIAVGDEPEEIEPDGKDPAAKALGAKGGAARARSLSAKKRSEIAKKAARSRWKKRTTPA